jgi:hypothetical protein
MLAAPPLQERCFFLRLLNGADWVFVANWARHAGAYVPVERWRCADAGAPARASVLTLNIVAYTWAERERLKREWAEPLREENALGGPELYAVTDARGNTLLTVWKPRLWTRTLELRCYAGARQHTLVAQDVEYGVLKQMMRVALGVALECEAGEEECGQGAAAFASFQLSLSL